MHLVAIGTREHAIMRPSSPHAGYFLAAILLLGLPTLGQAQHSLTLQKDDVATFLDGTSMVHLHQSGQLEAILLIVISISITA